MTDEDKVQVKKEARKPHSTPALDSSRSKNDHRELSRPYAQSAANHRSQRRLVWIYDFFAPSYHCSSILEAFSSVHGLGLHPRWLPEI
jgi:hypothetical protein